MEPAREPLCVSLRHRWGWGGLHSPAIKRSSTPPSFRCCSQISPPHFPVRLCSYIWVLLISGPSDIPLVPSNFSGTDADTHSCAYNTQACLLLICPTCLCFGIGRDTLSITFVIVNVSLDFGFATSLPFAGRRVFVAQ